MNMPAVRACDLAHPSVFFFFLSVLQVVYADISQGALRQEGAIREAAQSTVYSDLRFS